jgi:mono/diheme cytochrome c family protein
MFFSLCPLVCILALIFRHGSDHGAWIVLLAVLALSGADPAQAQTPRNARSTDHSSAALYRKFCQRCHGAEGGGERNAGVMGLPDFRRPAWQEQRSDAQLMASILDGKGDGMPAFRGRLSEGQARTLVAYVRGLNPKAVAGSGSPTDFEVRFQELRREFEELRRQLNQLSAQPSTPKRTMPPAERIGTGEDSSAAVLYREHCQRCHGADGKGDASGLEDNSTPDFTNRAWQQEGSDARLLKSLLQGKGAMPAFRKHLTEDQAADLIEYLRGFAPRQHAPLSPPA